MDCGRGFFLTSRARIDVEGEFSCRPGELVALAAMKLMRLVGELLPPTGLDLIDRSRPPVGFSLYRALTVRGGPLGSGSGAQVDVGR
jgi:hypothetical protein